MSAIAGFWSIDSAGESGPHCAAMLAALAEYGPDDRAAAGVGSLTLGRVLYRLLPEDAHDRQPLVDPSGRFALASTLRLDNRAELIALLGIGTARAIALADSDLLFAALLRWGEAAVARIEGDFAFAFFDSAERKLLLARDPLGQRPLFWHSGPGFVAFASMPKGLHALPAIATGADEGAVAAYLAGVPRSGPRSYHRGIDRVEPGHVVAVTPFGARARRYWSPIRRDPGYSRFDDLRSAFREQLDRAVACRLRGAGAVVATHLSGGWDSSAVTATAARLAPPDTRLLAFTAVPGAEGEAAAAGNRFADESRLAAATAALYPNVEHVMLPGSGRSPLGDLEFDAGVFERPLFNLCNHVWLSEIRSAARAAGAKVLLTGEIGNWTISAAPSTLLADLLRQKRWSAWRREAAAMLRNGRARWRGVAANSVGPWLPAPLWRAVQGLSASGPAQRESPLPADLWQRLQAEAPEPRRLDNFERTRAALFGMDFGEYRTGILGGWGLDKRDPTADVRLVEFCLSLPIDMLLKDGVRRPLARAALADRVPAAVLDESRKGYQSADWHVGLTRDRKGVAALVEAIAACPKAARLIDVDRLRALLRDWPSTGWEAPETIANYRLALLKALTAGHFILAAEGGDALPARPAMR